MVRRGNSLVTGMNDPEATGAGAALVFLEPGEPSSCSTARTYR